MYLYYICMFMEKSINKKTVHKDLEELFEYVPPDQLRRSIREIFSRYLQTVNNDTDLEKFKSLAEDFYFLDKFLEKMEELGRKCA
jgi:hypothetical protein